MTTDQLVQYLHEQLGPCPHGMIGQYVGYAVLAGFITFEEGRNIRYALANREPVRLWHWPIVLSAN